MKILAIGDFHGTFSGKFERLIKKEKIDLVVSNGDFFPFVYRELWFKHCYHTDVDLWEVIGKNKTRELVLEDLRQGEGALKKLNALPVPVITIVGNLDYIGNDYNDQYDSSILGSSGWNWYDQDFFSKIIKKCKNIERFDYSYFLFGDYVFIGARGGTSPGNVKSASYRKHRKKLDKLFKKFKGKKVIFVSHNVPYNTKLDKISMKAHEHVRGKHYGSKLIRRVISRWKPLVHVGGHIHEGRGKDNIGKTICVNPGAAHEGHAAIIDLNNGVKVRFI